MQRDQRDDEAAELGQPEQEGNPDRRQRRKTQRQVEPRQRQDHRGGVEQRNRQPFARCELEWRHGCCQQRLERGALALAGGRVERGGHAAHHRGKEPVERDEEEHERAGALRRGEIARLHAERTRDVRRDAAQNEPAASPFAIERPQQRLDLGDRCPRPVARTVVGEADRARPALRDIVGKRGVDLQHHVEVAAPDQVLEVVRGGGERQLLPLEKRHECRRTLQAGHGQRQLARLVRLARDQIQHQQHQHGPRDNGRHERHQHRAAVAEDVDDLLPRDHRNARQRRAIALGGHHAARPSPEPSSRTKASSSEP